MKQGVFLLASLLFTLLLLTNAPSAYAYRYYAIGYLSGCTCHSNAASSATTVTVTSAGGDFTVNPSATEDFTISVSHASLTSAGVNIGVKTTTTGTTNIGTLNAGQGLRVYNGEISQSDRKTMTGGSASWSFQWTAPNTPGTYYLRAVGLATNTNGSADGNDLWNSVNTITMIVPGVRVTAPNTAVNWCSGATQNITWTAGGFTTAKIELTTDGGSTWSTITSNADASTGTYGWAIPQNVTASTTCKIRISDASNPNMNDGSDANFTMANTLQFTSQPTSISMCSGAAASFSVAVTGTSPAYQWKKNGTNITGATSATYTIPSTSATTAGSYTCTVTNACGSITSNAATLTISTPPAISNQPFTTSSCNGGSAVFGVIATGTNITYQWRKNGVDIPGATTSTYTINKVAAADTGNYDVTISGFCPPNATSTVAKLIIKYPPGITQNPQSKTACVGDSIQLSVGATGSDLTYRWLHDGNDIPGGTGAVLTIPSVSKSDAGVYNVIVSGSCTPNQMSTLATLTVNESPNILSQIEPPGACLGLPLALWVKASGAGLKYQWSKNGIPVAGATSDTLRIPSVSASDAATYTVKVSGSCNPFVTSDPIVVGILKAVEIKTQPIPRSIKEGSSVSFSITATGDLLKYQWYRDGVVLVDDTLPTLTLSNVLLTDAGHYSCIVSNPCGNSESHTAQLSVIPVVNGPFLSPSATLVEFGAVRVTKERDSVLSGYVRNLGNAPLTVTGMQITGKDSANFSIVAGNNVPFTLAPDETHDMSFKYTAAGVPEINSANVVFTSNSVGSVTVLLKGEAAVPHLTSSVSVGSASVGSSHDSTIIVCNTGKIPMEISSVVVLVGSNAFSVLSVNPPMPFELLPDSCFTVDTRFSPTTTGAIQGSLGFIENSYNDTVKVILSGNSAASGVEFETVIAGGFVLIPNPMRTDAAIILNDLKYSAQVYVVNAYGQTVKQFGTVHGSSKTVLQWDGKAEDGSFCPSGAYRLILNAHGKRQSLPFVIVR